MWHRLQVLNAETGARGWSILYWLALMVNQSTTACHSKPCYDDSTAMLELLLTGARHLTRHAMVAEHCLV
jgi:hypothetical protein